MIKHLDKTSIFIKWILWTVGWCLWNFIFLSAWRIYLWSNVKSHYQLLEAIKLYFTRGRNIFLWCEIDVIIESTACFDQQGIRWTTQRKDQVAGKRNTQETIAWLKKKTKREDISLGLSVILTFSFRHCPLKHLLDFAGSLTNNVIYYLNISPDCKL